MLYSDGTYSLIINMFNSQVKHVRTRLFIVEGKVLSLARLISQTTVKCDWDVKDNGG